MADIIIVGLLLGNNAFDCNTSPANTKAQANGLPPIGGVTCNANATSETSQRVIPIKVRTGFCSMKGFFGEVKSVGSSIQLVHLWSLVFKLMLC